MFQLSIRNEFGLWQSCGQPMSYENGKTWQELIGKWFPEETTRLKRVVAQYIPCWLESDYLLVVENLYDCLTFHIR